MRDGRVYDLRELVRKVSHMSTAPTGIDQMEFNELLNEIRSDKHLSTSIE